MKTLSGQLSEQAYIGDLESIKKLMLKGANIHYSNDLPLRYSSQKGHIKVVDYLINVGANVNALEEEDSALFNASQNGHLDIVKLLISYGAKITQKAIYTANFNKFFELENYLKRNLKNKQLEVSHHL